MAISLPCSLNWVLSKCGKKATPCGKWQQNHALSRMKIRLNATCEISTTYNYGLLTTTWFMGIGVLAISLRESFFVVLQYFQFLLVFTAAEADTDILQVACNSFD